MMRSRRRSTAAFLGLAAMLFLQAAIAFAACELPDRAATMLQAIAQSAHSDMPDCHEADQNAGLCVAHCATQDQTVTKAQFNLPDLAFHPAPAIRIVHDEAPVVPEPTEAYLAAAGPPARILFQSFLL